MDDITRKEAEEEIKNRFLRLDEKERPKFLELLRLLIECPAFVEAYALLIPPGAEAPSWDVAMAFMDEWMAKGQAKVSAKASVEKSGGKTWANGLT